MSEAEILIVGGGITGCAIAYYLAKEGVRAHVIEKDAIGSAASGMAPGVLSPLTDMNIPESVDAEARWHYIEFKLKSFHMPAPESPCSKDEIDESQNQNSNHLGYGVADLLTLNKDFMESFNSPCGRENIIGHE